jgi:hypothetical protein
MPTQQEPKVQHIEQTPSIVNNYSDFWCPRCVADCGKTPCACCIEADTRPARRPWSGPDLDSL